MSSNQLGDFGNNRETHICNCGIANRVERIVGGENTEANEYPWQIGIVSAGEKRPWCGGSILTRTHILTAAHCIEDETPSSIQVRAQVHFHDKFLLH